MAIKQINFQSTKFILVENSLNSLLYSFLKLKSFFGKNLKVHVMPRNRSVDINNIEDLKIAKFYASQKK